MVKHEKEGPFFLRQHLLKQGRYDSEWKNTCQQHSYELV
jgi:hypothetical protein